MSQERTEAIVLRGVDFSETSRIVTFLTPDRGRLACMAAGARRSKSGLAPVLDTFNRVELVYYWKDGRSVQRLAEASLLDGYGTLKADLDKTVLAAFPLELVLKTAQEDEPSEDLYATLVRGLEELSAWSGSPWTHTAWHVVQLLAHAGFAPALDPEGGMPAADGSVRFSYAHGVVASGEPNDRTLTKDGRTALASLSEAPEACPADVDPEAGREVFHALRGYVTRQLETDLRSLRVIEQVLAR
ncbi:MAG: DNA repair protein RecO [bacterium]|nr:DNA repair protein RecO [bacterium]